MEKSPTVAILMATYNGEKYLAKQLDSLFSQTYQNFKIYVSDDCSQDTTLQILKRYTAAYPEKIIYTDNQENVGYVKNFEKLLYTCQEKYIALSDQDDIWEHNKLELLVGAMLKLEELHQHTACLVHSDLSLIDQNGTLICESYFKFRNYDLRKGKDLGHILGPCGVMGNALMMNRTLKNMLLPFPEKLDVHDYWIALHAELFGVRQTLSQQLVQYRIHNENHSNNKKVLLSDKKKSIFCRDIKLPYMDTNRKYFLEMLLPKVTNQNDRKIIEAFLQYLNFNHPKVVLFFYLIKYSLIKRDMKYRATLFFKMLLTKRY